MRNSYTGGEEVSVASVLDTSNIEPIESTMSTTSSDSQNASSRNSHTNIHPVLKGLAGSLGGVAEACALQPMDVIKTRLQLDTAGGCCYLERRALSRGACAEYNPDVLPFDTGSLYAVCQCAVLHLRYTVVAIGISISAKHVLPLQSLSHKGTCDIVQHCLEQH